MNNSEEHLLNLDNENEELAAQVIDYANRLGLSIGCAESCTGGLIAQTITRVSGSSAVFVGGIVSYACSVKESVLGVDASIFKNEGVVSETCASAMAKGAVKALNCDMAVSTTGIAGPSGALPGKPVGTVCFGLHFKGKTKTITTCKGESRKEVRLLSTKTALLLMLDVLKEEMSSN